MGQASLLTAKENRNITDTERAISALGGAGLIAHALMGKKNPLEILGGSFLLYRAITGHCPAIALFSKARHSFQPQNITIKSSVTVNKPIGEVYSFWCNLENLPIFMTHLKSVEITGEKTSLWKAKIPGNLGTIDWHATIVHDEMNKRIGWRSDEDASVENAGTIHFRDGGKFGTELLAIISYEAPAGKLGEGVGRLLNPAFEGMVREDIKNFKRYIESGEIPTISGQPSGTNN